MKTMSYVNVIGVVLNATFKIKHSKLKGMQAKESNMNVRCGEKITSIGITVLHHEAYSDLLDGNFYPHLTPI